MPPFRALTAAAVLALCGGCSAAGGPADLPAAAVAAPCAETAPTPPADRPPALAATTSNWYGQGDLWVALPDYPPVPQGDALVLKFPMVTLVDGLPTASRGAPAVTAVRADAAGAAPGQVGGFAQAFGTTDLSFWPASVAFPSPGCWTVTGLLAAESVQFTMSVEEP
ncbi:hypothetical protein FHX44_113012 [Pseudonocardia hierapolitana]|uniref:Uncharacterized protein n=1 Tax=Pseudonocardia hierapolitana TaxID=1128676 RepID=A0A561SQG4_9PSEU|nr:hypothetical protein [Pseudonocardia hierapolitana]TWF77108.1 hypothetical protein FHX44_113012 [Pseudonocardia hierapolitana]